MLNEKPAICTLGLVEPAIYTRVFPMDRSPLSLRSFLPSRSLSVYVLFSFTKLQHLHCSFSPPSPRELFKSEHAAYEKEKSICSVV